MKIKLLDLHRGRYISLNCETMYTFGLCTCGVEIKSPYSDGNYIRCTAVSSTVSRCLEKEFDVSDDLLYRIFLHRKKSLMYSHNKLALIIRTKEDFKEYLLNLKLLGKI